MTRRFPRLLGATAAAAVLATGALAPMASAADTRIDLYDINDFHGRVTSTGKNLACTVLTEREANPDSLFLSAGDNIGASEFASMIENDQPTIDLLNTLDLSDSAVGNHEFDKGMKDLTDRVQVDAEWEYLGANVYDKATGERALPAYTTEDVDGVKIGIVGAVTDETPSLVSPAGIKGLEFKDAVSESADAIEDLKAAEDPDVVVVLLHDGADSGAEEDVPAGEQPPGNRIANIVAGLKNTSADIVFTGHTHKTYSFTVDGSEGTQAYIQTGSYGAHLGHVSFTVDPDTDEVAVDAPENLDTVTDPDTTCAGDETYQEAAQILDAADAHADEVGSTKIADLDGDVTTAWPASIAAYEDGTWTRTGSPEKQAGDDRSADSALGALVADSMLAAEVPGEAPDVAVMNPGGLRADMFGDDDQITYMEANNVLPFVNNLNTVDVTGAQLAQALEQQWQPDGSSRAYLQLAVSSNVTYTYDTAADAGERITGVTVNDEPLDPDATYTVIAPSFLLAGGDNFTAFAEGTNLVDTGLVDRDAWIKYLEDEQPISADYAARGVEVTDVAEDASETLTFTVRNLESTSLGAPEIKNATFTIEGKTFTAPYEQAAETATTQGEASAKAATDPDGPVSTLGLEAHFEIPVSGVDVTESGTYDGVISSDPDTGTAVTVPVSIDVPEEPEPTDPAPTDPEPSEPAPSDPAPTDPEPSATPTASPTDPGRTRLPRTGADVLPYALGGIGLVALGGGALALRRKLTR